MRHSRTQRTGFSCSSRRSVRTPYSCKSSTVFVLFLRFPDEFKLFRIVTQFAISGDIPIKQTLTSNASTVSGVFLAVAQCNRLQRAMRLLSQTVHTCFSTHGSVSDSMCTHVTARSSCRCALGDFRDVTDREL